MTQNLFSERFGKQFETVGKCYATHNTIARIEDVSPWLSELVESLADETLTKQEDDYMHGSGRNNNRMTYA